MGKEEIVLKAAKEAIKRAVLELPLDVIKSLQEAYKHEYSDTSKTVIASILENIELAKRTGRPICQDTGLPSFFIEIGRGFNCEMKLEQTLIRAVKEATDEIPLRPNSVNTLTQKNSGDNTGKLVPYFYYEFSEGDKLKIIYFPKGAGSENNSKLFMLNPSENLKEVERIILEHVAVKACLSCPPIIVGVGLGGGGDIAMHLAKKALLRPLGSVNSEPILADIEKRLLKSINKTGIGPMSLGGGTTALAVHIEYADRHTASLPVGIVFQCWAARRSQIIFDKDFNYTIS